MVTAKSLQREYEDSNGIHVSGAINHQHQPANIVSFSPGLQEDSDSEIFEYVELALLHHQPGYTVIHNSSLDGGG